MGNEIANIQISKDVIEPIVRAQLHASIAAGLGRSEELVAQVVHTIMHMKVDSDGKESRYDSGKPLITWMAEDAIKKAAKEAIIEWFADNKDKLKEDIKKAIAKNSKAMAEQFVMGMCNKATKDFYVNVGVNFGPKD
jgi:hypothetical protein